jgi:hypothetical protein
MEPNSLRKLLFPLFLGLATAFGIAIGYFLPGNSTVQANQKSISNSDKMQDVMHEGRLYSFNLESFENDCINSINTLDEGYIVDRVVRNIR